MTTMTTLGRLGVLALGLGLLVTGSAQAGILVTKKGRVFVGKINPDDIKKDSVVMRKPKTTGALQGLEKTAVMHFEMIHVRWYDPDSNTLTKDYWRQHKGKVLDPSYQPPSDPLVDPNKITVSPDVAKLLKGDKQKLRKIRVRRAGCEFRPPENWERQDRGDICVLIATGDKAPYQARIHLFSVERPRSATTNEQMRWYRASVMRALGVDELKLKQDQKEELVGTQRKNIVLTTVAQHKGQSVITKRYVLFRSERVYFISCYATEAEYGRRRKLFDLFRQNLSVLEDD